MTLRTSANIFRGLREPGIAFLAGTHNGYRTIYMLRARGATGELRRTFARFAREAHHDMLRLVRAAKGQP